MSALGPGPLEHALTLYTPLQRSADLPRGERGALGDLPPGFGTGMHWSEPRPPRGAPTSHNPARDPQAVGARQRAFRERLDAQVGPPAQGPERRPSPALTALLPGSSTAAMVTGADPGPVEPVSEAARALVAPPAQTPSRAPPVDREAGSDRAPSVCLRCGGPRCCGAGQLRVSWEPYRGSCRGCCETQRGCGAGCCCRCGRSPSRLNLGDAERCMAPQRCCSRHARGGHRCRSHSPRARSSSRRRARTSSCERERRSRRRCRPGPPGPALLIFGSQSMRKLLGLASPVDARFLGWDHVTAACRPKCSLSL